MKIEGGWNYKMIKSIKTGDIFYLCGCVYIKTDHQPENVDMIDCVELVTGKMMAMSKYQNVGVIEKAVLKIGGFYGDES